MVIAMPPKNSKFTHSKNNPKAVERLRGTDLKTPNCSYSILTPIITEMKSIHKIGRSTTGLDLTLLPWNRRRSLAVDMNISLNDRIREIGGDQHG